jgi:hypothetical protein
MLLQYKQQLGCAMSDSAALQCKFTRVHRVFNSRVEAMAILEHNHLQPIIFHRGFSVFRRNDIDSCHKLTAVSGNKSNDEIFEQIYWLHKSQYKILYRIVKRIINFKFIMEFGNKISIEIFCVVRALLSKVAYMESSRLIPFSSLLIAIASILVVMR